MTDIGPAGMGTAGMGPAGAVPAGMGPAGAVPAGMGPAGAVPAGVVPAGQGLLLTARGNVLAFKAVAAQTGGDFSLMERTVPPGARTPPPHRHVNCSEAFFVLDGTVTFRLDGAELTGGAGDFLLVPRGAAHTFGNRGDEPARLLVLHAPAMDAYFAELHALWSGEQPPTTQAERELMSRHGMEPA